MNNLTNPHGSVDNFAKNATHGWQFPFPEEIVFSLKSWFNTDYLIPTGIMILRIGFILLILLGLWHFLDKLVDYYAGKIPHAKKINSNEEERTVLMTVVPIIRSALHWMLIILAILLTLTELHVNIMPIIYSFSIITLAISFSSQTLFKDLINGMIILFEGSIAVGDMVTIGNYTGVVETISLRCVHLRHKTGELQSIPFSEVKSVINCLRDFNIADIKLAVPYKADLNKVKEAFQAVYELLKKDAKFKGYIIEDLKFYGVSELAEWGAKIHASVKIIPDPEKLFLNEFNRLLLLELQKRQIPLPGSN